MANMSIGSQFSLSRQIALMQGQMNDLQRQLATGKTSDTYGGLGNDRLNALSLQQRVSAMDGFLGTIGQVEVRLTVLQQHLDRLSEIAGNTRGDALTSEFDLVTANQTQMQLLAADRLNETIALLNFELGGRHFFSGRSMDTKPVENADLILYGDGTRAGLKQIIAERKLADLGADGRGRLVITAPAPDAVNLAEDADPSPFGFKLAGMVNGFTGTAVTQPAGSPPSIDVTFSATLPNAGEEMRLLLDLPDGTQETVLMTAVAGPPTKPGEFEIGVDEIATAANFQAALGTELERQGQTVLSAAAAKAAGDDFFNFDDANPPRRVAGPPFETATTLQSATPADTVFWYVGDAAPGSARDTAVAKADNNLVIGYGARANEGAFRTMVANLAVLAVETFDATDPNAKDRYGALSSRVAGDLAYNNGAQSVLDVIGEIGFKQSTIDSAKSRHEASKAATLNFIDDIQLADSFEVSSKLLSLQTRLQVSFEASSLVNRLSLVNFL